jgi:CheY-like chemotaxis protein
MIINCIIVEDEPLALERTKSYVQKIPYLNLIGEFDNGVDALAFMKNDQVDLILLDIEMDDLTGIELLKTLINPPKIIITTAYENYALQGYELNITDYEPGVTWIEGAAGVLPFGDDEFDAVVSQFGLMFFPDRVIAAREMLRCVKPTGRTAVAVWDALERSEAYPISVELLERRAGGAAADALRAPFVLGDAGVLRELFEAAGASSVSIETHHGTARFPSVRAMVEADLRGWLPVMGVVLEDDLIEQILDEADQVLAEYVSDGGEMVFDAPAHIVTAAA